MLKNKTSSNKSMTPSIFLLILFFLSPSLSLAKEQSKSVEVISKEEIPESFFYLGAKIGLNYYQNACEPWSIDCDQKSLAGGLFGGYQFSQHFSFEASYLHLGEAVATYLESTQKNQYKGTMKGAELSLLGRIDLSEHFGAFAKAGTFNWYGENKGPLETLKADDWAPMVGLGFTYQLSTAWQARVEYQYFHELGDENIGGTNAHLTTLGIQYRFGSVNKNKPRAIKQKEPVIEQVVEEKIKKSPVVLIEQAPEILPEMLISILFNFDDDKLLTPEALSPIIVHLKTYSHAIVSLKGYADSTGNADYNLKLSKRRVYAISRYLVDQGVDNKQIISEYFGEDNPALDNLTPEHQHKNRRVLVHLPETVIHQEDEQSSIDVQGEK